MIQLSNVFNPTTEYGCLFGSIANSARYMGYPVRVADLYVYGNGISDICYNSSTYTLGNPLQFEIMIYGLQKYGLEMKVHDKNKLSAKEVWQCDEEYIRNDCPVIILAESRDLKYHQSFSSGRSMGHALVLVGIDYENRRALIADTYIPAKIVEQFYGFIPFDELEAARSKQKNTSIYISGEYSIPKIPVTEAFFNDIEKYINGYQVNELHYGISLIQAFHDTVQNMSCKTHDIQSFVGTAYFDIKMRGILTQRLIIQEFIDILVRERSDNKLLLDCSLKNKQITLFWNKILQTLVRWQIISDDNYKTIILDHLKKIKLLDEELVTTLINNNSIIRRKL